MHEFIMRHQKNIRGVLSGFDRMRFRGTLRWLANTKGMKNFLWKVNVLFKHFGAYSMDITNQIKKATTEIADEAGRPVMYVNNSHERKEDIARQIAEKDGVTEGLIAVLTAVEPCMSYEVGPNAKTKHLELRNKRRKCLHQYFYFQDPEWGLMHVRLQTWFPFTMFVCLNGREWLARQMDAAGIGYRQRDNCFVDVEDVDRAQELLMAQTQLDWHSRLTQLGQRVHPTLDRVFNQVPETLMQYYWSLEESEWATDVMFKSAAPLDRLYPRLIQHGLQTLSCADVLRFLGKKLPAHGGVHGNFTSDVITDLKNRPEGMRLKHMLNHNTLKMYNKQGSVLRIETTINNTRDMKVFRRPETEPEGKLAWRRLRKGVADIPRRVEVSQVANERCLQSLAAVDTDASLEELTKPLCQPVMWQGRRARALNPWSVEDGQLLKIINHGEFMINGFRNRDIRALMYGEAADEKDERRQSAAVTRSLRLLRAHQLIKKVPKTHRYVLTHQGVKSITAILSAREARADKLTQLAG